MAILSRRTLTWAPGLMPSLLLRSMTTRLVSTNTTKPPWRGRLGAAAACVPALAGAPGLGGGGVGSTDTAIFWRGLMRPPPGGAPYFATISGEAMRLLLPKTSVPMVVGILSSSTQMYSASLGRSPKRGFLMRSHFGSAALISTEGSESLGIPASSLRVGSSPPQAESESESETTARQTSKRGAIPFIAAPSIADSQDQSSGRGSQGKRCSPAPSARARDCRREKSGAPVTAEIQVTSR